MPTEYRMANKAFINRLLDEEITAGSLDGWVLQKEWKSHANGYVGSMHDKMVDGFPFPWVRSNVVFNA